MNIRMVDTISQYQEIQESIDVAVNEVIRSGIYINGPVVQQFRKDLANFLGAGHVITCANGTDALQVALMALDLQPGDEIITPTFTYVATVEVIALLRLKPVFVDVDPHTFNIDPQQIEAAITERTRAIIPVHLYGHAADMAPILEIARKHQLAVVEDNAQAIGASYKWADGKEQRTGTLGDIGCTSFYPSKNLGAYGDGGAICTSNDQMAEYLWMICNHGSKVKYYHETIGVNSRLDAIQAAILGIKLQHLDRYNNSRRAAAAMYTEHLKECEELILPTEAPYTHHVYHQYTLRIKAGRAHRDAIKAALQEAGIPSMIYYPVSLHQQDAYKGYGYQDGQFPVAEQLTGEVLSLPMHSELDEAQITHITQKVKQAILKPLIH